MNVYVSAIAVSALLFFTLGLMAGDKSYRYRPGSPCIIEIWSGNADGVRNLQRGEVRIEQNELFCTSYASGRSANAKLR